MALKKYKSNGNTSFSANIKKEKGIEFPLINIDFGCHKVSLKEPSSNSTFNNLSFKGSFTNGKEHSSASSVLKLNDIKGEYNNQPFNAGLTYKNFEMPFVNGYIKGDFPLAFFMAFSDSNELKNISGNTQVDLKLKAYVKDLENANHEAITSSGQVFLKNVSFENKNGFYKFKNLDGSFIFNKNDIAISDFKGVINNSDFNVNGYLKGFFSYLFSNEENLVVLADLKSNHLDFDQLIESNDANGTESVAMNNKYLQNIQFNLNGEVEKLKWGKFRVTNAAGNIRHNNLVFSSNNITGEIGNGKFGLNGILNSKNNSNINLNIGTTVDNINIDSIFYFFNNFNEDFITHENLKGRVFVKSTASMNFDQYLNLKPKTLVADIDIRAINGELNDFEPMQNLSSFLNEDELKNIRFSELNNTVHIENEKIEIPNMRINSSVSNINIRGSHTFNNEIYYKLKVPLKNLKPAKRKEAESAFESTKDGLTVHLIISGTTDEFTIRYDTKSTKQVIKDKVKEEIKDVKEIIKGNNIEEEEEQIELEEEDYFEFEEDSTNF